MATFEVPILRVDDVQEVPNSDFLTVVTIGGYKCIANKKEDGSWRYKKGDLVVYIPEGAVVPEWILRDGFWDAEKGKGILAGPKGDRVKAIKLRGVLSQGILRPVMPDYEGKFRKPTPGWIEVPRRADGSTLVPISEGDNVADILGIVKYEPPIPPQMAGQVVNIGSEYTVKFDIENLKRYFDLFEEGEVVQVTEKLHGTCSIFGYVRGLENDGLTEGDFFAASKGLGAQGLVMKDVPENQGNLYLKAGKDEVFGYLKYLQKEFPSARRILILGEIYGKGVQDLAYNTQTPEFRAFDIFIEDDHSSQYVTPATFENLCEKYSIPMVPRLYMGPYTFSKVDELSKGVTTLGQGHVREGVVIRGLGIDERIGRRMLKHINPKYLTRKDGTEYN